MDTTALRPPRTAAGALLACIATGFLGGCVSEQVALTAPPPVDLTERDCLMRAMYFESNRSSYDGMMAVGTVVMNRKESGRYGNTVCSVVGQRNQFAPGALTRKVSPREGVVAEQAADAVMAGKRHPNMDYVMFFHTAGLHFPYSNMHYRLVAGGNAFYERYPRIPKQAPETLVASTDAAQRPASAVMAAQPQPVTVVASAVPDPAQQPATAIVASQATGSPTSPQPAVAAAQPAPMQPVQPVSTVVAAPQGQTTLAYVATASAAQPDPESPLYKFLTKGPDGQPTPPAQPPTTLASATVSDPVASAPAGARTPVASADISAPVPR